MTRELVWDIQSHTGMSCRSKADATAWVPCTADTAPGKCDPTSPCMRRRVDPLKVWPSPTACQDWPPECRLATCAAVCHLCALDFICVCQWRQEIKEVIVEQICYRAQQIKPSITDEALFTSLYGRSHLESHAIACLCCELFTVHGERARITARNTSNITCRNATTASCAVCFALRIASRPFFIERVEVGALIGSTHPSEMLPLSVNSSISIELVVADDLGKRAYVYVSRVHCQVIWLPSPSLDLVDGRAPCNASYTAY